MGFVGGGGNICHRNCPTPIIVCALYCKHQIVYGFSLSQFLWLPETSVSGCGANPGPRRPVPAVCRIICGNVRGLAGNLSDLTVASSQYDMLLCSETLFSDMRHVSEVLVPSFCRPVLLCRGKMPRARGRRHTFEVVTEHFANLNLSVIVAKCCFLGFVV